MKRYEEAKEMIKHILSITSIVCAILCAHGEAKKTLKVHNVCDNDLAASTKSIYVTSDCLGSRLARLTVRFTKVRFTSDPKKADKTFYFTTFSDSEADMALEYTSSASSADVVFNAVDNWAAAKYRVCIVKDADETTKVDYTICITHDKAVADVKIGERFSTAYENQRKTAIMYVLGFFK